jgi:hypothetical protein
LGGFFSLLEIIAILIRHVAITRTSTIRKLTIAVEIGSTPNA